MNGSSVFSTYRTLSPYKLAQVKLRHKVFGQRENELVVAKLNLKMHIDPTMNNFGNNHISMNNFLFVHSFCQY